MHIMKNLRSYYPNDNIYINYFETEYKYIGYDKVIEFFKPELYSIFNIMCQEEWEDDAEALYHINNLNTFVVRSLLFLELESTDDEVVKKASNTVEMMIYKAFNYFNNIPLHDIAKILSRVIKGTLTYAPITPLNFDDAREWYGMVKRGDHRIQMSKRDMDIYKENNVIYCEHVIQANMSHAGVILNNSISLIPDSNNVSDTSTPYAHIMMYDNMKDTWEYVDRVEVINKNDFISAEHKFFIDAILILSYTTIVAVCNRHSLPGAFYNTYDLHTKSINDINDEQISSIFKCISHDENILKLIK